MTKKVQKTSLNPVDITRLINAMKVVFPTREEVKKIVEKEIDKKITLLPSWTSLDQRLSELPTRDEFNKKIHLLPTKDEFFTRMDKLSGEIQKVREEQILHAGDHGAIDDRFERIDKHIGFSTAI